jgi:hypothetical protein
VNAANNISIYVGKKKPEKYLRLSCSCSGAWWLWDSGVGVLTDRVEYFLTALNWSKHVDDCS